MPTRTTDQNPFAPHGTFSRAVMLDYADGSLSAERQHEVELLLEADPLLAEALDGLRQGNARAALHELDAKRPATPGRTGWWVAGSAFIVIALVLLIAGEKGGGAKQQAPAAAREPHASPSVGSMAGGVLQADEIESAVEQPEILRIGHEASALHARSVAQPRIIRDSIERIAGRTNGISDERIAAAPKGARRTRVSRQLFFLHDLKLVHPKELYAEDPVLRLSEAGVMARYSDRQEQAQAGKDAVLMPYTAFMEEAIGRFASHDHKGALDDLRQVLGQYPDDVNALFYGGLCAYNLGLFERARVLLHRAATHPIDVFDEEAAWYHALSLERMGERTAAAESFGRIAAAGGFYSPQAAEKSQARPTP